MIWVCCVSLKKNDILHCLVCYLKNNHSWAYLCGANQYPTWCRVVVCSIVEGEEPHDRFDVRFAPQYTSISEGGMVFAVQFRKTRGDQHRFCYLMRGRGDSWIIQQLFGKRAIRVVIVDELLACLFRDAKLWLKRKWEVMVGKNLFSHSVDLFFSFLFK